MSGAVYAVAQVQVKDYAEYMAEYATPTMALFGKYEAEVLAASPAAQAAEGEWYGNWTVIVRFPLGEAASAFFADPDYAPLKALRIEKLTDGANIGIVPEFDPAALAALG